MAIMIAKMRLTFFLACIFFIIGLVTLSHYGINWDTINHLPRGQAYLHYFLTGNKDFVDLPVWRPYYQNPNSLLIDTDIPKSEVPRRSIYESDGTTFNWFMERDGSGHPPLSDILSSLFNVILFQKTRLVNDIDSYRVYGVLLASALVGLVFFWTSRVYGKFAGIVAALSLALYPLFWAESHLNTEKDIPETVYWSFMLFSVWMGITGNSWKWILSSGIFFGLALGTKFNVIFSIFVIIPWLFVYLFTMNLSERKNFFSNRKMIIAAITAPLLGFTLFIASWPYLWPDILGRIDKVIRFYTTLGFTLSQDPRFFGPLGINTYPIQWIIYTTPIVILFLLVIGIFAAIRKIKHENSISSLLFLFWLCIPILRVTLPGTTIYGGIRQVMEYIPAMAILSGLGAATIAAIAKKRFTKRIFIQGLLLLAFLPLVVRLVSIHPNENAYFNELIGGLKGAKERDLPAWGHSFGAPYRQAAIWINHNSPEGSKVVLVNELLPNIPHIWFRRDITFHNSQRSGYLRSGEYAITLTYQGIENRSYYDSYLEKFIEPVYQVNVDGVAILKVWENDDTHLKFDWKEEVDLEVDIKQYDFGLRFDLGEVRKLSRLELTYNETDCQPLTSGYVRISQDQKEWQTLVGILPNYWKISVLGPQPRDGRFIEPFIGQEARFIDLVVAPEDTCVRNIANFLVYYFP